MFNGGLGHTLSSPRHRVLSIALVVMFLTLAMPGCLSLVVGREMMEGARGKPEVLNVAEQFDLSHTFVVDGTDFVPEQVQKTVSQDLPIDYTVQKIVINFQTTMNHDWVLGEQDERYVHVILLVCDETGNNCESTPIYERRAENGSYPAERYEIDLNSDIYQRGQWNLTVEGRGVGTDTGLSLIDFKDSWSLIVTIIRPCLSFPETPEVCTPTIEFD